MGTVERSVVMAAPAPAVWAAVADPERLSRWFGAEVSLDLRPGGRARFRWPDGSSRAAEVVAIEPEHLLIVRWLPFEQAGDGSVRPAPAGVFSITLRPEGSGIRVVVRETRADVEMGAVAG